jgi:uncharacterized protein (UPF0332 family)
VPDARAFLTKAEESLASAESDFDAGRYNSSARSTYYACFQAAVAALITENAPPRERWEHDFVHARFNGVLINRRKRYPGSLRSLLPAALRLRVDADYSEKSTASRRVAATLKEARTLVLMVKEKIDGDR